MAQTVQVSIPVPNSDPFYYSVPRDLKTSLDIGKRVLVPLGNRIVIGFTVGFEEPPDDIKLKNVVDIIEKKQLSFRALARNLIPQEGISKIRDKR